MAGSARGYLIGPGPCSNSAGEGTTSSASDLAELKASVRNSLRYFQTVRGRVKQLINGRPKKAR